MTGERRYLDHNATSPLKPAARGAMLAALQPGGNASSVHAEGRAARALIDGARERLAAVLGCPVGTIVFTSGGTEANNLALKGVSAEAGVARLVVSAVEHPSVLEAAPATGLPVDIAPVTGEGVVDLGALEDILARGPQPALVSVMFANNETGVLMPVREVVEIARRYGALVHTDAVQALGRVPVRWAILGADMMSVSAHKIGGPQGAGALIMADGIELAPLLYGGGQELKRRAGTENVPAISGFAAALDGAGEAHHIKGLRDRLETELKSATPEVVIFGEGAERLPNTTCFALAGVDAETALIAFDLDGVAVSSGSACSSGKVARSHVLTAMGVEAALLEAAIRVSVGWNSSLEDVERFAAVWRRIAERRRVLAAA